LIERIFMASSNGSTPMSSSILLNDSFTPGHLNYPDRSNQQTVSIEENEQCQTHILDNLGCAIAGLQCKPFQALRLQFEEYRAPDRFTLIGGGKTSADQAALFNSSLVRYVDLLDS
jgi:2-methylcitrate dehydratase